MELITRFSITSRLQTNGTVQQQPLQLTVLVYKGGIVSHWLREPQAEHKLLITAEIWNGSQPETEQQGDRGVGCAVILNKEGGINIKFDPRTLQNKGLSTETMRKGQEARVCTGRFRSVFGDHLCSVQDKQGELRQWASCWRPRRLLGTDNGLNYYYFLFVEPFDTRETNDGVNAVWHQESETILEMLMEGFCVFTTNEKKNLEKRTRTRVTGLLKLHISKIEIYGLWYWTQIDSFVSWVWEARMMSV